jgi:lipopolysaccharide/colanic/teichoic acid biosynthesis glycosyltransferase
MSRTVRLAIKRFMDLAVASVLGVVLSPIIAVVALAVRLSLGSPVLFRQARPGVDGETFTLVKFRTMRDAKDANGAPLSDRERLTKLGRFLRKTSLDELPEFANVIRGQMSFVGPRPLLEEYLPLYSPEQARRHQVRPGLTGLAQVSGRNALTWQDKFAIDVWYVDNWSLRLDLLIIWRTIFMVLTGKGVAADGQATMEPFRGNQS